VGGHAQRRARRPQDGADQRKEQQGGAWAAPQEEEAQDRGGGRAQGGRQRVCTGAKQRKQPRQRQGQRRADRSGQEQARRRAAPVEPDGHNITGRYQHRDPQGVHQGDDAVDLVLQHAHHQDKQDSRQAGALHPGRHQ